MQMDKTAQTQVPQLLVNNPQAISSSKLTYFKLLF